MLLILSVISTAIAVYSLISKGKASPAIAVVFDQKQKARNVNFTAFDKSEFWNNYPYLVLTNNNRVLKSPPRLMNESGRALKLKDLLESKPGIFFRIPNTGYNEAYIKKILNYLNQTHMPVTLLFDQTSPKFLKLLLSERNIEQEAYMLFDDLNELTIENELMPYFFVMNKSLCISRIYVPRVETPEVTENYLTYLVNKIKL